jgi:hypothetical protein
MSLSSQLGILVPQAKRRIFWSANAGSHCTAGAVEDAGVKQASVATPLPATGWRAFVLSALFNQSCVQGGRWDYCEPELLLLQPEAR